MPRSHWRRRWRWWPDDAPNGTLQRRKSSVSPLRDIPDGNPCPRQEDHGDSTEDHRIVPAVPAPWLIPAIAIGLAIARAPRCVEGMNRREHHAERMISQRETSLVFRRNAPDHEPTSGTRLKVAFDLVAGRQSAVFAPKPLDSRSHFLQPADDQPNTLRPTMGRQVVAMKSRAIPPTVAKNAATSMKQTTLTKRSTNTADLAVSQINSTRIGPTLPPYARPAAARGRAA
jgi:hypothetical protein